MLCVLLLMVGFNVLVVTSTDVIRKDGYCVSYGVYGGSRVPKQYNGPAKITIDDQFKLLRKTCPHLAKVDAKSTRVCCDSTQLNQFNEAFKSVNVMFGNCPAAYMNYERLWCELTCSPNQSKFLDYSLSFAMKYYISKRMANDLFNSMKNVNFPGIGRKALNFMCGTSVKKCTAQKFLDFSGNPSNGAPILIRFIIDKPAPGFEENNCKMISCNESFIDNVSGKLIKPCFHTDCPSSSRYGPTPAPPKKQAEIVVTIKSRKTFAVDSYRVYQGDVVNFTGLVHKHILRETLHLQESIKNLQADHQNELITMKSFCQLSNNSLCKVESVLQYFQMNERHLDKCVTDFDQDCNDPDKFGFDAEDWHDQIIGCTWNPYQTSNGKFLRLPCISSYGDSVNPSKVFAEYPHKTFTSAKAFNIRIIMKDNMTVQQKKAKNAWKNALMTLLNRWEKFHADHLELYATMEEYRP